MELWDGRGLGLPWQIALTALLLLTEKASGLMGLREQFENDAVVIVAPGSGYQEVAYPRVGAMLPPRLSPSKLLLCLTIFGELAGGEVSKVSLHKRQRAPFNK